MWIKYFSRGMSIQKAIDYADGLEKDFFKFFGVQLNNFLYIKNKENLDIYYQDTEFNNLLEHLTKEIKKRDFVTKFHSGIDLMKHNIKEIEKSVSKAITSDKQQLIENFLKIKKLRSEYYPVMWYNVIFESRLEDMFLKVMKKYPDLDNSVLLDIDHPMFIAQEEIDLLNIANNYSQRALEEHTKKYAFIPMYDYDYKGYDIDYFKNKNNQYKEVLAKVDEEDKIFLEFFHFSMWFKDERSRFRNYESYICQPLYQKISKRLKLTLGEVVNLTYSEIIDALNQGVVNKKITKSRKELFALLMGNENVQILDKKETEYFIKENIEAAISQEVRGACSSKGRVKGRVKIVLISKDINKVEQGDILISPMTRPDFILALKKSIAIVTDEGGLTCHAAIVSRELGIPCIVGTKIATQVFKDGDKVEVDATKGVVKKIR